MNLRHGSLVVDLPETWQDHSTLLFVNSPGEAGGDGRSRELVSISFSRPGEDEADNPRGFLAAQVVALRAADPGFELLAEGVFECALDAWFNEIHVQAGERRVYQLNVAARVGRIMILATAACPESSTPEVHQRLRDIVASLRWVRPSE